MDGLSEAAFYAQGQLDGDELLLDDHACGLPVSAQVDRLEAALRARLGGGFAVYEVELQQLTGAPRDVAFDAIVAGESSPFVIVDDRLVCTGSVEVATIIEVIERASTGKSD